MMPTRSLLPVICALTLVVATIPSVQTFAEPKLDALPPPSKPAPLLRSKLLQGTLLDTPGASAASAAAEFQQALETVAAESSEIPSPLDPPPPYDLNVTPLFDGIDERAASLRSAARTLDSLAADAEDRAGYPRAKSLRKLAEQVRKVAREL